MKKYYYTAHRLTAGLGRFGEHVLSHRLAPQQDISIVRRPFKQMRAALKIKDENERRVKFMKGSLEDREFLLIFQHGFFPEYAFKELKKGKNYWCESSNRYLHTGFGLTELEALKALLAADRRHRLNRFRTIESDLPKDISDDIAEKRNRFVTT